MSNDATSGDDEIRRLQGFINDLISIQALPAIWDGREPGHVISTFLDVLVSMLRLDFAYARLSASVNGSTVELVRLAQSRKLSEAAQPQEVGRALEPWLTNNSATVPLAVPNPVGEGEVRIAPFRLGLLDEIGVLVAGSKRADFPTQTETLLLRVAANQALAALREVRQLNEQKRVAENLEQRVAERTGQLTAVKDELAAELAAINGLHALSTCLLAKIELQPLLEEILNAIIALQSADFGNIQIYNPKTRALEIVAQRGFRQDFLDHFASVHEDGAACGRAMNRGERIIIEDVLIDPAFEPHRSIAASAGFRAVQSTPLFSRNGEPLGMISTHFRLPHRPRERELQLTDLYARHATELIERKQAEEALHTAKEEAERRAREAEEAQSILYTIMQYAPAGITLTGGPPDFTIIANSKHATILVGRDASTLLNIAAGSHAEAYGLLLLDGTRPRPEQLPLYRASHHGEGIKNEEWNIERSDGSRIHEISNVAPIHDFHGNVIGAINCWHEITDRKRAEEALRASEEHFRHMIEGIKDYAIFMVDLDGQVITWNSGAERMTGYSSQEILGRHFSVFYELHEVKSGKPEHGLKEAAATGRFEEEGWRLRKDGSRFWANVIVTALKDETGKVQGFSKMTRDMTERKRSEDALRASEERFRRYFELGLIGMAITSPAKGCLEVNDELCRILGYARGELLQKNWAEMTHPDDLAADVAQFNRVMAGEMDGYTLDKRWIRKDGRIIDSIMATQCLRRADGSVDYFVGLVLDTTERRRAEEQLRRSQAYLAEGQRLSHTASWAWNVSTGEIFWSAELFRIYGLEPGNVKPGYPTVLSYIHPDDRSRVQKTFEDAVREQKEYELAYRVVWSDGTIRHVHNIAHPVFDKAGTLIEYVGTTIDTTERIQAEEKLRRSEANLAEGQRISHTGSWAWNPSSGEIFSSQEFLRIFGLEPLTAPLTHKTFLQLVHPEARERIRRVFDQSTSSRTDYEADYRIVLGDGSIRHIHNLAHPVFNDANALVEYVGTAMDITERKQAEEEVRKAHEQVDLILASISDQCFGLSKDWRFTYFNQHAAAQMKLLGKDPVRLIGRVLWEEFPEVSNEASLRRVMSERVAITDELYYARLGEWVENHMYPSHDGGLVSFQRYITSRKRTEEELVKTRAELAHVTRITTMGELVASIAHEINQPLGAIVNNSNVCVRLLRKRGAKKEIREALTDIASDANRASTIITRIRSLTKRSVPEKTSLQLQDVVADVLTLAHGELAKRRITIHTELAENLPHVSVDRVQLQQVLLNLVMNGIEAMAGLKDERRILTIGGQRDEEAKPSLLMTVCDFGHGFKAEDSERLFQPFYTTKPLGMGMGLRISRSIVEAHGGRLWAAPNDGPGATFFLSLPIARDTHASFS